MTKPIQNALFTLVQWILIILVGMIGVAWALVVVPVTAICATILYFVLFVIGWTARVITQRVGPDKVPP